MQADAETLSKFIGASSVHESLSTEYVSHVFLAFIFKFPPKT